MKKYLISDYVTTMDVIKTSAEYNQRERNRFKENKHDLKSTVFKYYFYEGYFDNAGLSKEDLRFIGAGFSPIKATPMGVEYTVFTVHHIKPLSCSGETLPSNLIPLPRKFHEFIHEKIIDPQIKNLKTGETTTIIGVPDFSKLPLETMMDTDFRIQYYKYLVDTYRMIPPHLINKHTNEIRKRLFAEWYSRNFGNIH